MKLNLELNGQDVQKLFRLYNVISRLIRGRNMDTTIYELNCDACGNEYELSYIEEDDSPIYCPFCGTDVDLTDVDDESEENDFLDDFDFDKDD